MMTMRTFDGCSPAASISGRDMSRSSASVSESRNIDWAEAGWIPAAKLIAISISSRTRNRPGRAVFVRVSAMDRVIPPIA